jgi:hypothetical protein
MTKSNEHPTIQWWRDQSPSQSKNVTHIPLNADSLRELCIQAGADDAGFV